MRDIGWSRETYDKAAFTCDICVWHYPLTISSTSCKASGERMMTCWNRCTYQITSTIKRTTFEPFWEEMCWNSILRVKAFAISKTTVMYLICKFYRDATTLMYLASIVPFMIMKYVVKNKWKYIKFKLISYSKPVGLWSYH